MPTIRINTQADPGQTPRPLGLNLQWTDAAKQKIRDILSRYPEDRSRSAVIPLLHLAQREFGGWLPVDAMMLVAETVNLPYIRVYEVASFYTMFNLHPVGKHHIQVCTNCACLIRGSDEVLAEVKKFTGLESGQTSEDGFFTLTEVECLGACVSAPMMQVAASTGSSHYFTHLDASKTREILKSLKENGTAEKLADTSPAGIDPITHAEYGS